MTALWAKWDGRSAPYPVAAHALDTAAVALVLYRDVLSTPIRDLLAWALHCAAETADRALHMAVRIDQPGRTLLDYHTVNPPPTSQYAWLSEADQAKLATIAMGNGRPWTIKGQQQTLQTWRTYLTGAVFTWFLHGDPAYLRHLADALIEPYWPLSLGRKACLPDQPLVLGISPDELNDSATRTPATGAASSRVLHLFHNSVDPRDAVQLRGRTVTHADLPLGPHPHDRYGYQTRTVTRVEPPTVTRDELLTWAKENLS
ncbi:type I-E CRISPR-associated protein Cas5/CasD [Dactylosporangium sp. CA-152071]|uniref:type I-E CRISPR-associated protein Cas5/CasD n=1 Tax=Dactylosporangium sp. CA-152071 TaxID=3239933 RepID=UPI003D8DCB3E